MLASPQRFMKPLLTVISNPATSVFESPQPVGAAGPLEDVVVFRNGPTRDGVAEFKGSEVMAPTELGPELWTVAVAVIVGSAIVESAEAVQVGIGQAEDS